jgi:two-component system alkaline phosphatase synthesis response regulator PhoP
MKILIADDELSIRLLVRRMLSKQFVIFEASNGEEAVDVARIQRPDLILMDIMMPRMDGNTACSTLKNDELTKEIPVVMLTGLGYELNKKLAKIMGADAYITKPFSLKELTDTISQFVRLPE